MSNVPIKFLKDDKDNSFSPVVSTAGLFYKDLNYLDYASKLEKVIYHSNSYLKDNVLGMPYNGDPNDKSLIYDKTYGILESDGWKCLVDGAYSINTMCRFADKTSGETGSNDDKGLLIQIYDSSNNLLAYNEDWVRSDYRRSSTSDLYYNLKAGYKVKVGWRSVIIGSGTCWFRCTISYYGWEV